MHLRYDHEVQSSGYWSCVTSRDEVWRHVRKCDVTWGSVTSREEVWRNVKSPSGTTVNLFIETEKQLDERSKKFKMYDELLTPVDGIRQISIGKFLPFRKYFLVFEIWLLNMTSPPGENCVVLEAESNIISYDDVIGLVNKTMSRQPKPVKTKKVKYSLFSYIVFILLFRRFKLFMFYFERVLYLLNPLAERTYGRSGTIGPGSHLPSSLGCYTGTRSVAKLLSHVYSAPSQSYSCKIKIYIYFLVFCWQ